MSRIFALYLLICSPLSFGQVADQVYKWDDLINTDHRPDTIYHISMRKHDLHHLPVELYQYTNLVSLDLSKNHIVELNDSITQLKKLERIDLERNKLDKFPLVFCRMPELKSINLGMNDVQNVPVCLEGIKKLENLYLYDNPITSLPKEISNIKSLKLLDLSGIRFSPEFQKVWIDRLPHVQIEFDAPCDCMK